MVGKDTLEQYGLCPGRYDIYKNDGSDFSEEEMSKFGIKKSNFTMPEGFQCDYTSVFMPSFIIINYFSDLVALSCLAPFGVRVHAPSRTIRLNNTAYKSNIHPTYGGKIILKDQFKFYSCGRMATDPTLSIEY